MVSFSVTNKVFGSFFYPINEWRNSLWIQQLLLRKNLIKNNKILIKRKTNEANK
jgi:hypothetical protein